MSEPRPRCAAPSITTSAPDAVGPVEHRLRGVVVVADGVQERAVRVDPAAREQPDVRVEHGLRARRRLEVDRVVADHVGLEHVDDLDARAALRGEARRRRG